MAKLAQNFAKYLVHARMEATGIVEKPDIIGAIFGQTEGLLGTDLDLRELQRTGRIGRIEVIVRASKGSSYADIIIPSSLDASETALIAATLETIDKVGPCDAKIDITKVEDVRSQKRRYVIDRAKEVLRTVIDDTVPDSQKLTEMIKQAVRTYEATTYQGLSCGPDIINADEIVIVEGRADVINLLRNGVKNCIAIEGSKVPEPIVVLTREKTTTALLDGDRGGDLILKKLMSVADVDYVARAPEGKEVEEITKKQIYKALRDRIPIDQANGKSAEAKPEEKEEPEYENDIEEGTRGVFSRLLDDLTGTRAAFVVNNSLQATTKMPLSEINTLLNDIRNIYALVVDGKITQSLVDTALHKRVKYLVGTGYKEPVHAQGLIVLTADDLRDKRQDQKAK